MRSMESGFRGWTVALSALAVAGLSLVVPASAGACDKAAGKNVYTINCLTCHGETGKGDGPVGMALNPRPRDFSGGDFVFDPDGDGAKGTDTDLQQVITKGAGAFGGSPLMAPWAHLPPKDIENLVCYIRALKQ